MAPAHSTVSAFGSSPELRGYLGLMAALVAPDGDDLVTVGWSDLHAFSMSSLGVRVHEAADES